MLPITRGGNPFFAFFLATLDVDVHIIGVSPLLLKRSPLLPEVSFVEAFTVGQVLGEIRVHIAADFLDLDNSALHRILVGKREFPHVSQERDDVVDSLVQQEKTFINT